AEVMLARRLAVFAATFDETAVEQVCADDQLPAGDIGYVLGSLLEKSIVDTIDVGGEQRYRMLETLRVYATERLVDSGERAALQASMVRYYLDLAERLDPMLRSSAQLEAIDVYERENDNLTGALRAAIETSDADSSGRLLFGLVWYLTILGQSERARAYSEEVLAFGDRLPADTSAGLRLIRMMMQAVMGPQQLEGAAELIDECVRAGAVDRNPWLCVALPMVAFLSGHRDLARREIERALGTSDEWGKAAGRWAESFLLSDLGELDAAERSREEAHAGFAAVGDRWGLAMTLSFRASSLSQRGDREGAIAAYTEGLRLALELRSDDDAVQQWWRLAIERSRAGDHAGAWRELEAAERYAAGNRQLLMILSFGRAEILLREKRVPEAWAMVREIESMAGNWPFPSDFETEWLGLYTAAIHLTEGNPELAEIGAAAAVRSIARRSDMPDLAQVVELFAQIRFQQGRTEAAARLLGLSASARGRFDLGNPEVVTLIGELESALGPRYGEIVAEVRALPRVDGIAWLMSEVDVDV
ncbi:MAG TPA: AfsR/SARP family transcriptional regulator, partial [Amycolatopsis sp.]